MPLVKRQSGWFWGSKGPFDSKSKALAVARAAYARGYKEGQEFALGSQDEPVNADKEFDRVTEKNSSAG